MNRKSRTVRNATLAATLIFAAGANAQDAAETPEATIAEPNSGLVHLSLGADFANAYFFRGYLQNKEQFNSQFWMDAGFDIAETGDTTWTANVGIWNAFDDGDAAGVSDSFTENWYEADFYFGLGFEHNKWSGSATYTFYTSPADAFGTVEELIFGFGYDDSEDLGKWALSPSLTLAVETDESADGLDSGIFLGLGVEPGVSFDSEGFENFGLSFPAEVGLSLSDYYQDGAGDDETFGYFQVGAVASVDLPISAGYGAWTVSAGVHGLFLGDTPEAVNDGDSSEVFGTVGLSISY